MPNLQEGTKAEGVRKVLITGGAGFIGSHLTDELLSCGYEVRILDNLSAQVHGPGQRRPDYLNSDAELIVGDFRDAHAVRKSPRNITKLRITPR
jgi:dTDP-L-rhamnose 4-epimerase